MQEDNLFENDKVLMVKFDSDARALMANNEDLLVAISWLKDQAFLPDGLCDLVDAFSDKDRCKFLYHLDSFVQGPIVTMVPNDRSLSKISIYNHHRVVITYRFPSASLAA